MLGQAKKSMGQNFLKSPGILDLLVETGQVDGHDIIVEAGPGKGALTEHLLGCAREVIAVEKDEMLCVYLGLKFKNEIAAGRLKLITGDILDFDPAVSNLQPSGYKIIANIPYYITGQFIRHFLSEVGQPSKMVLMVQREVAKRIIGSDGKESLLSLSVKAYGTPRYVETVKAKMFRPVPKVDSAIILIDNISKNFFKHFVEKKFFELLRLGFSSKRKKLVGNLSRLLPREEVERVFREHGLDVNLRAEDLPLAKWKIITNSFAVCSKQA